MKRWHNVYFELGSQPSPSFKAHPLSFEQGSLHTGGLVAYRTLSIPGHIGLIMFLSGQFARNDHIDDEEPYKSNYSHCLWEFRKLTKQRDLHQHIPGNRR